MQTKYFRADVEDARRIEVVESDAHDGFDGFRDEIDASDLPADFATWREYSRYSHGNNAVRVLSRDGE